MNNPILLLVAWFVINLIIKSAKDKQKIEEAKRKRASQLGNKPKNIQGSEINRETLQRDIRKAISTIREEIDKQRKNTGPIRPIEERKIEPVKREIPRQEKSLVDKLDTRGKTKVEKAPVKSSKPIIESREDIVRGIILSEILSEPKSIQNLKRSI